LHFNLGVTEGNFQLSDQDSGFVMGCNFSWPIINWRDQIGRESTTGFAWTWGSKLTIFQCQWISGCFASFFMSVTILPIFFSENPRKFLVLWRETIYLWKNNNFPEDFAFILLVKLPLSIHFLCLSQPFYMAALSFHQIICVNYIHQFYG
jgi:hypothetical protein